MKLRKIKCDKRAQVFGMSFQMIFSILLIAFFVATAFIAIKFFLGIQKKSQIGFFLTDLQDNIDQAWQNQESNFYFNSSLPSGIDYVCFLNLSAEINDATAIGEEVYENVKRSGIGFNVNFILWPITSAEDLSFKTLKHLQLPSTNPYCIEVKNGKVSIKIDKSFDEALPRVS